MNTQPERPALPLGMAAMLLLAAGPALASAQSNLFGGSNPLQVFVDFMTGPFAYGLVIVGIVATGAALVFGSEFSGFARRMPLVAVAGGVVILADEVVSSMFGGGGFSVPLDMALQSWPWPAGAEAGP